MQSETLISTLVGDLRPVDPRHGKTIMAVAPALAASGSAILLLALLHARPDLPEAVFSFPFWMKAIYTGWIGAIGWQLLKRARSPDAPHFNLARQLAPPFAAVAVVGAIQWLNLPAGAASAFWLGSSWGQCFVSILSTSIPVLVATLAALSRFAPGRPTEAGAIAGLFAGGVAATVYGLHCGEVSVGFVLLWYSLGVTASTMAGAWLGSRLLRW